MSRLKLFWNAKTSWMADSLTLGYVVVEERALQPELERTWPQIGPAVYLAVVDLLD
jgi:hypothetical protein